MSGIVIHKTITISGDNMKSVTIPERHLKKEGGSTFLHVSTVPNYMGALLLSERTKIKDQGWGRRARLLARTDVIQQLVTARNEKIITIKGEGDVEHMSLFDAEPSTKRIKVDEKVDMPTTIVIDAPTIGDVDGIPIKLLLSWKKTAPLYVELTADVISYMRNACKWQLKHASIHRGRDPKKVSDESLDDSTDHEDIDSISKSDAEGIETIGTYNHDEPFVGWATFEEAERSYEATPIIEEATMPSWPSSSASTITFLGPKMPSALGPKITDFFARRVK